MLILTFYISAVSFGQIDDNLMEANWKPEKEKVIYGNTILRFDGKNDIGGITNIGYETFDKNLYTSLLDFKSKHIFEMYKDAKSSVDYFWKIGFGQRERKSCETRLELNAQRKTRLYSSQEEPRLWQTVGYDMR